MNRTYDYTLEEIDFQDDFLTVTYRIEVELTPGTPGQLYGPPERCYPPEGPECDILTVKVLEATVGETDAPLSNLAEHNETLIKEFHQREDQFTEWVFEQAESELADRD